MANKNYNPFNRDLVNGHIALATDSTKAMLVTAAHTPDQDVHDKRADMTNEISGTAGSAAR